MSNAGIDYGLGRSNVDTANGIRFGVISQHSVSQAWADSSEAVYGEPCCPKCGGEVKEYASTMDDTGQPWPMYRIGCADYACERCEHVLDSSHVFPEEPVGWKYSGDGYELSDCLDSDIFVLKSPFYTFARFCSPCVPGAGNLDSTVEDGVKTYCLGHDWFEGGKAPYTVFGVKSELEVSP